MIRRWQTCVALFGSEWTARLWPILWAVHPTDLAALGPCLRARVRSDGEVDIVDSAAAARAAALDRWAALADLCVAP